jgi:GGDEF domain-containing protein
VGAFHWADVQAQPYDGLRGSPGGYQASFRTVDAEVAATQQLERRARFDDLTGVLKRQEALTRLSEIGARERQPGDECGVLFIDVDDFKDLNDQRGHRAGDDNLVSLARRIEGIVRSLTWWRVWVGTNSSWSSSRPTESSDGIIARADRAMYAAKDHGRNRVISISA